MSYENKNRKESKQNLQNEYVKLKQAEKELNNYKNTKNGEKNINVPMAKKSQNNNISYKNLNNRAVKQETIKYSNSSTSKKKKKSKTKKTLIALAVILVVLGSGIYIVADHFLSKIDIQDENPNENQSDYDMIYDEDNFPTMYDVENADSMNDYMYKWYHNGGAKMSSKNVINVLLIGADNDEGTNQSRSDSIMLVSLNRKTKKITLISFMRDSYAYFNYDNQDHYAKLNSSYFFGGKKDGPSSVIKTLENLYKIQIDYYASLDFESFVSAVDVMGGITVEVQEYEASYINRTSSCKIDYGDAVTLNGKEALVFSRIRYSDNDSDFSRTRRQRQVITAFINSVKNASVSKLTKMVDKLLPYVSTNMKKSKIISLGSKAILQNWMSYEIQQTSMPPKDLVGSASVDGQDVLTVDYPACAQKVQNLIFGSSNIVLRDNRINVFNLSIDGTPVYTTSGSSYTPSYSDGGTDNDNSGDNDYDYDYTSPVTQAPITAPPTTETPTIDNGGNGENTSTDDGSNDIYD